MERSVLFADGPIILASALPDSLRERGAVHAARPDRCASATSAPSPPRAEPR